MLHWHSLIPLHIAYICQEITHNDIVTPQVITCGVETLYSHPRPWTHGGIGVCSEGGTLVMLPEVGHESDGVLTKSQLSKYQRRTYFDQSSLAIDILDDIYHRNYVVTILFSWHRSDIFSLTIGVFRAILQSLFRALWLVDIGNLRNFLGFTLVKARQMT